MANQVYANNMEVSCKQAAGKSICAFPDVCMTPPETLATPLGVPVPYPNTGMASDTTSGSTTVSVSGQEVMLKNKSFFKRSTGDEAGCAAKKGVMTSVNMGKVYFNAWSMDVHIEGENVVRNLDLTTHNHASFVGNSPAWPYVDEVAMKKGGDCHDDVEREKSACKDCAPHADPGKDPCTALRARNKPSTAKGVSGAKIAPVADRMADNAALDDCLSARKCLLQPYSRKTDKDGKVAKTAIGCCEPQTGHHMIEKASFLHEGVPIGTFPPANSSKKYEVYNEDMAPCVCAEGTSHNRGGTHELMHVFQKEAADAAPKGKLPIGGKQVDFDHVTTYGKAKKSALEAFENVFPSSGCDPKCLEAQIDAYHKQCGISDQTRVKAVTEGINPRLGADAARDQAAERASKALGDRVRRGVGIE
jgi:hypothetical protein